MPPSVRVPLSVMVPLSVSPVLPPEPRTSVTLPPPTITAPPPPVELIIGFCAVPVIVIPFPAVIEFMTFDAKIRPIPALMSAPAVVIPALARTGFRKVAVPETLSGPKKLDAPDTVAEPPTPMLSRTVTPVFIPSTVCTAFCTFVIACTRFGVELAAPPARFVVVAVVGEDVAL